MYTVNLAILLGSIVILGIGLFSQKITESNLTAPLITLAAGTLFGSQVLGMIQVPDRIQNDVIEEFARLSLAIALTSTALKLPRGAIRRHKQPIIMLLTIGMFGMWFASAAIIFWLVNVSFVSALLMSAMISPTDPILARTVAEGRFAERYIPQRIRNVLLAESSLNDGLAFPFVVLAMSILTRRYSLSYWGLHTVLWAVVGGSLLGVCLGYLIGVLIRKSQNFDLISRRYFLGFSILMALFSVMLGTILQMDGILTVIFAGLTYKLHRSDEETQQEQEVQTTADLFFTLPVFFLLGMVLPWHDWIHLGIRAIAIAVGVLFLRRLPIVLLMSRAMGPGIRFWRESFFVGWFGPIGVSALFYLSFALKTIHSSTVWAVVTLIIAASILVHGATAIPLTKTLGQWEKKVGRLDPEQAPSSSSRS